MPLNISPPLINSSNPWATTIDDLRNLYKSPYTGAVTTRTCTLQGFAHDDAIHQYTFFDVHSFECIHTSPCQCARASASLNTLGYSPYPLAKTLANITIVSEEMGWSGKAWIVSVTGSPHDIQECYRLVSALAEKEVMHVFTEINLSCPNIGGKPPPAYDQAALLEYLVAVRDVRREMGGRVKVGIKTPPYSNPRDFGVVKAALVGAVVDGEVPIEFITATNTLGTSLLLQRDVARSTSGSQIFKPALSSQDAEGIGGMAGAPLHPLALGNVRMLRRMLDSEDVLRGIQIIGIGGVSDASGFERMKSVGAEIVGVGTALGRKGMGIFQEIAFGGTARL
jgi:dihydroorotate dehydrogenase (fumarate)